MKKFLSAIITFSFMWLIACSDDSSSNKVDEQTASQIYTSVYTALSTAITEAMSEVYGAYSVRSVAPGQPNQDIYTGTINYANANNTIRITGSYTYNDETSNYHFQMSVIVENYICPDGTQISGEENYTSDGTSNNFTASYSGEFDVVYQGENYDFSWDITITAMNGNISIAGSYNINGNSYNVTLAD